MNKSRINPIIIQLNLINKTFTAFSVRSSSTCSHPTLSNADILLYSAAQTALWILLYAFPDAKCAVSCFLTTCQAFPSARLGDVFSWCTGSLLIRCSCPEPIGWGKDPDAYFQNRKQTSGSWVKFLAKSKLNFFQFIKHIVGLAQARL